MNFKKHKKLLHVLIPPFFILIIHYSFIKLYESFLWFDILTHFLGGMAMAYSASYIYFYFVPTMPRWLRILSVVSFVMLAATIWEFYEFILDHIDNSVFRQPSIADTMDDFLNGLFGSLIVAFFYKKR